MSKGTKKRGNERFNVKIIEVCGFCTNYGVEAPSTYAIAQNYEDYSVAYSTTTAWWYFKGLYGVASLHLWRRP